MNIRAPHQVGETLVLEVGHGEFTLVPVLTVNNDDSVVVKLVLRKPSIVIVGQRFRVADSVWEYAVTKTDLPDDNIELTRV